MRVASLSRPMRIAQTLLDEIIAHARDDAPNECCGMVAGRDGRRPEVYRARNAEASPLRYTIHPQDQIRIMMEIEERGEEIAAIYHSHTKSPAEPSQTDINLADNWPDPLYLICSLADPDEPGGSRRSRSVTAGSRKSSSMSSEDGRCAEVRPLACPRCARKYPLDERFCADCGMPLVYVGRGEEEPITEAHERARKIKPQYTGGRAGPRGQRRQPRRGRADPGHAARGGDPERASAGRRGFDVPDFLAAGPRDILVPEAGLEAASEVLADGCARSAGRRGSDVR